MNSVTPRVGRVTKRSGLPQSGRPQPRLQLPAWTSNEVKELETPNPVLICNVRNFLVPVFGIRVLCGSLRSRSTTARSWHGQLRMGQLSLSCPRTQPAYAANISTTVCNALPAAPATGTRKAPSLADRSVQRHAHSNRGPQGAIWPLPQGAVPYREPHDLPSTHTPPRSDLHRRGGARHYLGQCRKGPRQTVAQGQAAKGWAPRGRRDCPGHTRQAPRLARWVAGW
jgi:hypothetical protein